MRKEKVYSARFYAPGSFVAEDWYEKVPTLNPRDVRWPARAYCFRLYEREDVIDKDGARFKGESRQVGPTYYHPESEVVAADAIDGDPRATDTLRSNVRCNGWSHIVWSRWGNWPQPFNPAEDVVLEPAS